MKTLKRTLLLLLILLFVFSFVAIGFYFIVTKDVKLRPENLILQEKNVVIYDNCGNSVKEIGVEFKQNVRYEDIPKCVLDTFVQTEDKRFYSHNGFDFKRIVKAGLKNLKAKAYKQGASTISQQLIKNTHLTQEKTLKRKLQEWKLTHALEKSYTKQEILEKYLNAIYFGHNCFGLHSASQFYFNKQPQELELADAAILAGLVKSPNRFSPFKHPENCEKRKKSVLQNMLKNQCISKEEYEIACNTPLPVQSSQQKNEKHYSFCHFVFEELTELSEINNFSIGGKIEIYTSLDQALQEKLQTIAINHTDSDIALGVLNTENNRFKGYLSTLNNPKRSPASLLKPLLIYGPAIEENVISPATPILDEPIRYGDYAPENFDRQFHGYLSARECLAKSLNVPAVKLLESLGVDNATKYLEKMHLFPEKDDLSLTLALGGMKNGFTFPTLLSAYATLQNGEFTSGGFIEKIKINNETVYAYKPNNKRVFSSETSYLVTDMLQTAVKTGTAKKLRSLLFPIAAKTGTAGTANGNTDAYAISYTTRDIAGVWLGNADNSFISHTGGGLPCNYLLSLNEYLQEEYTKQNKQIEAFIKPQEVVKVALDKTAYYDTHSIVLADENSPPEYTVYELFKKTSLPLKKSDLFTNPNINPPILQYKGGNVTLQFHTIPTFYEYKIERYDYVTHKTLYQGKALEIFTDNTVEKNKRYLYSVTPIYNNRAGKTIYLPEIYTGNGEAFLPNDQEITEKDWWNY